MKPYMEVLTRIHRLSLVEERPWTPERQADACSRYQIDPAGDPIVRFGSINPPTGRTLPPRFDAATRLCVAEAARAAGICIAHGFHRVSGSERARLLDAIATKLRENDRLILSVASRETGLTRRRLARELARACGTFDMFAGLIRDGSWVRAAVDTGTANPIGPNHDVRRMLLPLGAVAVFGASNFPLAYGVTGGDTASALAAGCPVIIKGHPLHPATGEFLAGLVIEAIKEAFPRTRPPAPNAMSEHPFREGIFAYLQAGGERAIDVGSALVRHPFIKAVGFTGSREGGEALVRLATTGRSATGPIPVFAEMGSVNPIMVFPHAAESRGEAIAEELAASIVDSSGQQCTCPGFVYLPDGPGAERFESTLKNRLQRWRPRAMLGRNLADHYRNRLEEIRNVKGATVWSPEADQGDQSSTATAACRVSPAIVCVEKLEDPRLERSLWKEIFGPAVVIVRYPPEHAAFSPDWPAQDGCLVASLYADPDDLTESVLGPFADANALRKFVAVAGRVVINGPPTGVRVAHGMSHGGPWPATNRPDTTAVGPYAIERWCRPVCFQNCPDALLPPELQDANPLGILRTVNGVPTRDAAIRAC